MRGGLFAPLVILLVVPGCARKPATSPGAKTAPTVVRNAHDLDAGVEAAPPIRAHKVDGGIDAAPSANREGPRGEASGELCISRVRVSQRFKPVGVRDRSTARRRLEVLAAGLAAMVDEREAVQFSTQTGARVSLPLDGEHVAIVRNRSGRRETLVRFDFKRSGSAQLCLWYREMYDNWHLSTLRAGHRFEQCLHCRLKDAHARDPRP